MAINDDVHPVDLHIGSRIRLRRKLLAISQTDLADALGLTFQQVQKYERGSNRVSASKLYEIAQRLDVSIGFFFEGLSMSDNTVIAAPESMDLLILLTERNGHALAEVYVDMDPEQRVALVHVAHSINKTIRALAA